MGRWRRVLQTHRGSHTASQGNEDAKIQWVIRKHPATFISAKMDCKVGSKCQN